MSWFNETHEGDNPESNATKNLDNTEANGEDVDKKMDDFASDVDSGKVKSSFWDKINPFGSKFSKKETVGEGKDNLEEAKKDSGTERKPEKEKDFMEGFRYTPEQQRAMYEKGMAEWKARREGTSDSGNEGVDSQERDIGNEKYPNNPESNKNKKNKSDELVL